MNINIHDSVHGAGLLRPVPARALRLRPVSAGAFRAVLVLCCALFCCACSPLEPDRIVLPEHFRMLGSELHVRRGEVSGPLALYEVWWRGEELLPLGYSQWSGVVDATHGPGVSLLVSLYPDGSIPRDLNCAIIIKKLAEMPERWLIEARWLEDALISDSLGTIRSYLPAAKTVLFDFGDDVWISSDPFDEKMHTGTMNLLLYPGERRVYIAPDSAQVLTVYLDRRAGFRSLLRPARPAAAH